LDEIWQTSGGSGKRNFAEFLLNTQKNKYTCNYDQCSTLL